MQSKKAKRTECEKILRRKLNNMRREFYNVVDYYLAVSGNLLENL